MTEAEFIKRVETALSTHVTPASAATSIYRICCDAADAWGMKPEIEVAYRKPGQPRHHPFVNCYSVAFEAGPPEWAARASMNATTKARVLAEPYYGFDLCISKGH